MGDPRTKSSLGIITHQGHISQVNANHHSLRHSGTHSVSENISSRASCDAKNEYIYGIFNYFFRTILSHFRPFSVTLQEKHKSQQAIFWQVTNCQWWLACSNFISKVLQDLHYLWDQGSLGLRTFSALTKWWCLLTHGFNWGMPLSPPNIGPIMLGLLYLEDPYLLTGPRTPRLF